MLLRKRNLNINNTDSSKDASLAVKRKNSNAKTGLQIFEGRKPALVKGTPAEIRMMTQDPMPTYDFDAESENDPTAMATYARDIFIYYKYREQFFKVGDYFPRQKNFNRETRARMVDWMVEVQETFELNHETLYLSVKLLDMYLDNMSNIELERFQLAASAAILVASKFDERMPPLIDDFVYLSNDVYTRDQIICMERELFQTVKFDLGAPISYRYLRRYARVTKLDMPTLTLARFILETSLMVADFCRVSESLMALGCYLLAVRMKKIGDWTPILQKYSGFTRDEVEPLVTALNHMMCCAKREFRASSIIYNKYSHEIFFEVASIAPLPDELSPQAPVGPPACLLELY